MSGISMTYDTADDTVHIDYALGINVRLWIIV